jgi:serine/threonine-protein kinase
MPSCNVIAAKEVHGQTFRGIGPAKTQLSHHHHTSTDRFIGRIIDRRYSIEGKLGSGALGTVYLATDLRTQRKVALKIYKHLPFEKRDGPELIVGEAEIIAKIDHENIVKVFGAGIIQDSQEDKPYIVMEYLEGQNLSEYLSHKGTLSWDETKRIAAQVCCGLDALHARGIIHRDIKPENIFITDGKVKIIDFDLSKFKCLIIIEPESGHICGTAAYMSPEQASGMQNIDHRTDIYALGVTMYVMLSGRLPFAAEGSLGLIMAHKDQIPRPLGEWFNDFPHDAEDIIMRALEKKPERRYKSTEELRALVLAVDASFSYSKELSMHSAETLPLGMSSINFADTLPRQNTLPLFGLAAQ